MKLKYRNISIKDRVIIFFIQNFKIIVLTLFLIPGVMIGCENNSTKDELFYESGELLDIKRDDEGQFHLQVLLSGGRVITAFDAKCEITMGNYSPTAQLPYIKYMYNNEINYMSAWPWNSGRQYSEVPIKIYIPTGYKIPLFED